MVLSVLDFESFAACRHCAEVVIGDLLSALLKSAERRKRPNDTMSMDLNTLMIITELRHNLFELLCERLSHQIGQLCFATCKVVTSGEAGTSAVNSDDGIGLATMLLQLARVELMLRHFHVIVLSGRYLQIFGASESTGSSTTDAAEEACIRRVLSRAIWPRIHPVLLKLVRGAESFPQVCTDAYA